MTLDQDKQRIILAVLAHPDDESFGMGGALAKYADEGVGTYLVTATRGERGRFGAEGKNDLRGQGPERRPGGRRGMGEAVVVEGL